MRLPLFRYSLGQLVAFVSFAAVLCFVLTTSYWPMVLAIAIVTPGFMLDRRQGGAGILGSMLAGILGFGGIGFAFYVYIAFKGDSSGLGHTGPGEWLIYLGFGGLVCGTIFGLSAWSILFLAGLVTDWPRNTGGPRP